jgi:hypothetical protein
MKRRALLSHALIVEERFAALALLFMFGQHYLRPLFPRG